MGDFTSTWVFGDDTGTSPDALLGDDLLAFADIKPPQILAIPRPQQFAEKIHAYTFPWPDRVNMRTKDLVDLVLLIETGGVIATDVVAAIRSTFIKRHSHEVPQSLPEPPMQWAD